MRRTEKKLPKILLTGSALALILIASGCSDNQSTSHNNSHSTQATHEAPVVLQFNTTPVANAGTNQIVSVGDVVTLNGTQSTDADHDLMSFSWTQKSGPSVELINFDTLTASFIAPSSKEPLQFSLTVNDGQEDSAPSVVNVTIANRTPLANAGRTITAKRGAKVELSGLSSVDYDSDKLTYTWSQVYGPVVELENAHSGSPTFTMPFSSGYLVFALTVNDGIDESVADTVAIKSTNTPPVAKIAPITDNVDAGDFVRLDGSPSFDADGDNLAYSWNQVLGTPVLLDNTQAQKPSFKAPKRPDHLVFELTVNDGEKTSHTDSVIVSVKNVIKPFEIKKNPNKIAKLKDAETLVKVKRVKDTLDFTEAPDAVENFLPEIAKSFIPAVQASTSHGDDAGHGSATTTHEESSKADDSHEETSSAHESETPEEAHAPAAH